MSCLSLKNALFFYINLFDFTAIYVSTLGTPFAQNTLRLLEKGKPSEGAGRKAAGLSPLITKIWQQSCQAIQRLLRTGSTGIGPYQGGISCEVSAPIKMCLCELTHPVFSGITTK